VNPKRTPGTGKSGLTLMLNLLTEQKETKKNRKTDDEQSGETAWMKYE